MIGQCLCNNVIFEISGSLPNLYQCHCSKCRKVSGSSSNSAMLIEPGNFKWLCGADNISSYSAKSGFTSDFCKTCGSPVPNKLRQGNGYWVPVGLLEGQLDINIAAHLYVDSKACWDLINSDVTQYTEMPDIASLNKKLRAKM